MKNTCTVEIEAPIGSVFDLINDPEKHKLWFDGLEETIYEPDYDPDHPLGAKFKQKIHEGKDVHVYDGVVTAFKRPSHLGIQLSSNSLLVQVDYRLKASKKVTRVEFSSELTFKSVAMRALATLSGPLLRSILQKQMNNLKELAEAGS